MTSKRRENDRYFTPEQATNALLQRVAIKGIVFEPCAGDGSIVRELIRHSAHPDYIWANDIVESGRIWQNFCQDATDVEQWESVWCGFDWIVTNPPFSLAPRIVPLAFKYARVGIAMLLRKTYTEPCFDRQHWLNEHRENFSNQIFLPRISFTGNGKSDNVTCDWYVWKKEKVSGCKVEWVLKAKFPRDSSQCGEWAGSGIMSSDIGPLP